MCPTYDELGDREDRKRIRPDDASCILQGLQSYPYSSFCYYLSTYGAEFLTHALVSYSLPDYSVSIAVWRPQKVEDAGVWQESRTCSGRSVKLSSTR